MYLFQYIMTTAMRMEKKEEKELAVFYYIATQFRSSNNSIVQIESADIDLLDALMIGSGPRSTLPIELVSLIER